MSNHETHYESHYDRSPMDKDLRSQDDIYAQVYHELRKVASLCEGGEEALVDLAKCLSDLCTSLDRETEKNDKITSIVNEKDMEMEQLRIQIEKIRNEREDLENKASELEADFEVERKKMMKNIEALERKSNDSDRIIDELGSKITQNDHEYRYRIDQLNVRYQQLQETHRDYVERMEEELETTPPNEKAGKVSLAAEIKEVINKQKEEDFFATVKLTNSEATVDNDKIDTIDDNDEFTDNYLTSYSLTLMFIYTTITTLPSILSTSGNTSWEEILKSLMDPFLMPSTSMPPI